MRIGFLGFSDSLPILNFWFVFFVTELIEGALCVHFWWVELEAVERYMGVLQATMVCMDNSEWMRNGDYSPTRFQAQADAINLICGAKTQVTLQDPLIMTTMI